MDKILSQLNARSVSALLLSVLALFWNVSVSATTLHEARSLLDRGEYAQAVTLGKALGSSEGFALAAEALSAQIILGRFEDLNERSLEALNLAEKSVALDPESENANVQYALAYGVMTRTSSVFTAWRKKYPLKSFEIVEALRAQFPESARGEALLGAWHLGVIRKAGEKNGQKWYGASIAGGITAYTEALKRAPQDILIASTYALSLYILDSDIYAKDARDLLEWVAKIPAKTALDREVKDSMAKIILAFEIPEVAIKMSEDFLDGRPL